MVIASFNLNQLRRLCGPVMLAKRQKHDQAQALDALFLNPISVYVVHSSMLFNALNLFHLYAYTVATFMNIKWSLVSRQQ